MILSSVESVELLLRSITVEKEEDPTVYHICWRDQTKALFDKVPTLPLVLTTTVGMERIEGYAELDMSDTV